MKKPKFLRTESKKYSKLGVRRKKKQIYRKSKGRDNKIRLKMKGHLRNVSAGFRTVKKTRGLIEGLKPILVYNLTELKSINDWEIGIIAKIGDKKRKEIAEYASKEKIKLVNLNPKKFLKNLEFKLKKKKQAKEERNKTKTTKEKKKEKESKKAGEKDETKKEAKTESTEKQKSEDKEEKTTEAKQDNKDSSKQPKDKTENKKQIQTNNYGRGK